MPDRVRLTDAEAESRSAALPQWDLRDAGLDRRFRFHDFVEAFSFMTSVALLAERRNHHPEWSNVYNTVTIRLTTHDVAGLSENDFAMAEEISRVYERYPR